MEMRCYWYNESAGEDAHGWTKQVPFPVNKSRLPLNRLVYIYESGNMMQSNRIRPSSSQSPQDSMDANRDYRSR